MRVRREISIIRDLMVTDDVIVAFVTTDKMLEDDLTKKTNGEKLMDLIINNNVKMIGEKGTDGRFKNPSLPLLSEQDEYPANHGAVVVQISDSESERSRGKAPVPRMSTGGIASSTKLAVMGRKKPIG